MTKAVRTESAIYEQMHVVEFAITRGRVRSCTPKSDEIYRYLLFFDQRDKRAHAYDARVAATLEELLRAVQ